MKWRIAKVLFIFPLFFLTACWDKHELTERGFVQGVGLDLTENGEIQLTTHFYKPAGGASGGSTEQGKGGESHYFNITTVDDSVFEAVRDITIHLGRKAQWSHMRVIAIGEELAKEKNVWDILEFFSRDHEPRGTTPIIIAKGKASDYFTMKPYIESTLGEHLRRIQEAAQTFSQKTIENSLLQINIQRKSESGVTLLPYMYIDEKNEGKSPVIAGAVLFTKGRMAGMVSPENMKGFLMLTNQTKSGIIEIDCEEDNRIQKDTFEIVSVKSKMKPKIIGNSITVKIVTKIEGSIGELHCHKVDKPEQEIAFAKAVEKTVKREMETIIEQLQEKKLDAIGIGDKIYRKNPQLWGKLKKNWGEEFSELRFVINVQAKVRDTGMNTGKPISK